MNRSFGGSVPTRSALPPKALPAGAARTAAGALAVARALAAPREMAADRQLPPLPETPQRQLQLAARQSPLRPPPPAAPSHAPSPLATQRSPHRPAMQRGQPATATLSPLSVPPLRLARQPAVLDGVAALPAWQAFLPAPVPFFLGRRLCFPFGSAQGDSVQGSRC